MQEDIPSQDFLPPATPPSPRPLMPEPQPKNKISRLLIAAIICVFIVLLATITVLGAAVIKKYATPAASNTAASDDTVKTTRQVVATTATKNDNIDFLVYTPRQTSNNTTIDFALKNTCDANCPVKSYAAEPYSPSHTGTNMSNMYLIDESAAEKYTVITDTRDIGLVSPQCYGNLKPGQKIDCFISFAKVPSGSTVSLVMRDFRIDNILVP